jgi:uncharacterized protein
VPAVSWLSVAPVKGLALVRRDELTLERYGALENRRFHLLDSDGRFVNGLTRVERPLFAVVPEWDEHEDTLRLRFPDGREVKGPVRLGEPVSTWFYDRAAPGRLVEGPWSEALTAWAGRELRLARTDEPGSAVDRSDGPVSLVSDASADALAAAAEVEAVDVRRFRMLIGIGGTGAHEEDEWVGREVRVGEAVVRVNEQVARCAITTKHPDTGERDLDTLRVIKEYRGQREGRHLDFGVCGEVVRAGRVRVGDPVEPG